jgi:endonuclease YncB( thermonuclease family)
VIRWPLIGAFALVTGWGSVFPLGLAQAQGPASATVLSIGDGDTIRVLAQGRKITIRLACIDAPEVAQNPHGQRGREVLRMRLPTGWAATGRHSRLALMSGLPTLEW